MSKGLFITLILVMSGFALIPGICRSALPDNYPPQFQAGASRVEITRWDFENYDDADHNGKFDAGEVFWDTGADRLYNFEEDGAFGADGKPGKAGVDDDRNGEVDDCERSPWPLLFPYLECREYATWGSDDVWDPSGDDYCLLFNPGGTEMNLLHDGFGLAGFGINVPLVSYRATNEVNDEDFNGDGFSDGLWVRALAAKKGDEIFVLLEMDLIGMLHNYINPVKRRIAEPEEQGGLGIPVTHVVIGSTHTHDGPDVVGLWDLVMGGVDDDYLYGEDEKVEAWDHGVTDRMFLAAKEAVADLRPAKMRSAQGEPFGCYDPETLELKYDCDCRLAYSYHENVNPQPGYDQFIVQNDLRDPWVRDMIVSVLHFVSRDSEEAIATLVNFANHPEVLGSGESNIQSSDYPHYVREKMEVAFGGISLFLTGNCGSQIGFLHRSTMVPLYDEEGNPVCEEDPDNPGECIKDPNGADFPEFVYDDGLEKIRSLGFLIGDVAIAALDKNPDFILNPDLEVLAADVRTEMENPFMGIFGCLIMHTFEEVDLPEWSPAICKPCLEMQCYSRILNPMCRTFMHVQVNAITIGDAQFVTTPGEVCPEYLYGREAGRVEYDNPPRNDVCDFPEMPSIMNRMTGKTNFVIGCANSFIGYMLPYSDYLNLLDMDHPNYYEEEVSLGENYGDAIANGIMILLGDPNEPFGAGYKACWQDLHSG